VLDKISDRAEDAYNGRSLKQAVNIFKKHYIRQTLDINRWNQTKTAELLEIQRTYLSRLIKELNINR
jgi:DNA-binding NtrC family response regulator